MMNNDANTELSYLEKKKVLMDKNNKIQNDLNSEIESLKANVFHYGKYALVIGSTFVATYYLAGFLFPSDKLKPEKKKVIYIPSEGNEQNLMTREPEAAYTPIVRMIMGAIATFLLSIAKEKLIAYLEEMSKNKNEATKDVQPAA